MATCGVVVSPRRFVACLVLAGRQHGMVTRSIPNCALGLSEFLAILSLSHILFLLACFYRQINRLVVHC